MLKKHIKYEDFNGNAREEDYLFNLTKSEIMAMNMEYDGGLVELLESISSKMDIPKMLEIIKDTPYNCAQTIHVIPVDQNFEKERNSSALFAREINLVTQPSFDCEQGINSQVQTACSNADAIFPVLGIVSCRNERFSLSRKTHVPLWNEPRISHVRLL